jgi:ferredoxin
VAWKVVVDPALCESNAFCMGIVPEVFELDDDNYLHLLQDRPPEELRDECEQAMRQCPRQAISIHDR